MDAFDADVLIYAVVPNHSLGRRVRALFTETQKADPTGIGSVLLIPELLTKPLADEATIELRELGDLLGRLELIATDANIARLATVLGARYGLRAADAVHLATAVDLGADRFITNNNSNFPESITEIDITYPDRLPDIA